MKGIILHGGHGTRLRPLTHTGPKQLLPIANKPMSQYCVESLVDAGITDIAFIVGGVGSIKVQEYYGDGSKFNAHFSYIEQDSPKGIAHAISLCENFVKKEKFVVFLGDNIIQRKIHDYASNFEKSNTSASLLLCEVENPSQFGIAEIKNNRIFRITEKPKTPPTNLAVTGIYFLTSEIFEIIKQLKPSWRNELEISDALQTLIDNNHEINYDIITDFWKDTGTPNDIIEANRFILENINSILTQSKKFPENTIIGEKTIWKNSKISGPAIIGKNCILEDDCIIGENSSIGDNCHLSRCKISNSIIMNNCTIKGEMNIVNSIISSNSKIIKKPTASNEIFLLGEGTQITL